MNEKQCETKSVGLGVGRLGGGRRRSLGVLGGTLALGLCAVTSARADDDRDDDTDARDWPTYNHDASGSRAASESKLGVGNVSGLHPLWNFPTPAPVTGTPVVIDDRVYAGDASGAFYALTRDGNLVWSFQASAPVTSSAVVARGMVVFGDINGTLYGLKANKGTLEWSFRPDAHPTAALWGSPLQIGKYVAVGVASNEEQAAANPQYPCCSFRGSLVLLDPKNGSVKWKTPMITDAESAAGASGASIWSTPTYDSQRKLIYVTTGNNFTEPATPMSDAIVAVDAGTGAIRWANQRTASDVWNVRFPNGAEHPDFDFGDSPQVYDLPNHRRVVGAGQKSGFYHVVDATTGATVNQIQAEPGGSFGGLFADTAVANGVVFANGINWPNPSSGAPPVSGDLVALSGDASHELWRFTTPQSPDFSGVAVANSVVYFTSMYAGKLYGLNATTGAKLAEVLIGVSQSGPSISRGQVYVGTGDSVALFFLGQHPTGSIVALGI